MNMAAVRSSRQCVRILGRSVSRSPSCSTGILYEAIKPIVVLPSTSHRAAICSRSYSISSQRLQEAAPSSSGIAPPKSYSYEEILDLTTDPSPHRILIDVREPSELLQTGRIPTARSVPISSAPDAFFMTEDDFEAKFGFPRPTQSDEVIFYCKAGVRSRQAAALAAQARPTFGGNIANYNGSWLDWEKNGGRVEREGEQPNPSSTS